MRKFKVLITCLIVGLYSQAQLLVESDSTLQIAENQEAAGDEVLEQIGVFGHPIQ